jgi:hypothetical protein
METTLPRGVAIGIGLQIASFLTGYLSMRYLYAMGWFGCLTISVPLFLASPFRIMRAAGGSVVSLGVFGVGLCEPANGNSADSRRVPGERDSVVLRPGRFARGNRNRKIGCAGRERRIEDTGPSAVVL